MDPLDSEPLQMATGLAKTKTAQDHLADTELAADKMVERHAMRYEVASGGARLQSNLAFSGQGLERFHLDERDLPIGAAGLGEGALLKTITVAFQPASRYGLDFLNTL